MLVLIRIQHVVIKLILTCILKVPRKTSLSIEKQMTAITRTTTIIKWAILELLTRILTWSNWDQSIDKLPSCTCIILYSFSKRVSFCYMLSNPNSLANIRHSLSLKYISFFEHLLISVHNHNFGHWIWNTINTFYYIMVPKKTSLSIETDDGKYVYCNKHEKTNDNPCLHENTNEAAKLDLSEIGKSSSCWVAL